MCIMCTAEEGERERKFFSFFNFFIPPTPHTAFLDTYIPPLYLKKKNTAQYLIRK